MWWIYALFSAVTAALVALFGKLGLSNIDSTLATTVRSIIMAVFLILVTLVFGKFDTASLLKLGTQGWIYIILAGIAGALSWLFYFFALKVGPASFVGAIDRLSIVFILILSAFFLKEELTIKSIMGGVLIVIGALLIVFK